MVKARKLIWWSPAIAIGAGALLLTWSSGARAEDCYVQRFSYSTSVNCGDRGRALILEDNTRNRHGRRDNMPSRRREPTTIYRDGTYCSQTGSVWSCR